MFHRHEDDGVATVMVMMLMIMVGMQEFGDYIVLPEELLVAAASAG